MIIRFNNVKRNNLICPVIIQFDKDELVAVTCNDRVVEGELVTTYELVIGFIRRSSIVLEFSLESLRMEAFDLLWTMIMSPTKETNKFYNKIGADEWH